MYYMNKSKRNLILASAIINLIGITTSLIMAIILITNGQAVQEYLDYMYFVSYSVNIVYTVIAFAAGLVGSLLLIYSVRSRGKYFRTSQGFYIAGFIIIVIFGGFLPWILLFISMFIPDVVVMNTRSEVRREERMEEKQTVEGDKAYEEKKKRIEDLKRMRDSGLITEEEYKEKLFELL